jgi:V/A-type H+-transporting ATPase subunit A
MIREDFLQQSAYSDTDSFCPVEKQYLMLKVIMEFYENVNEAMARGVSLRQIQNLPLKAGIGRMKDVQDIEVIRTMMGDNRQQIAGLGVEK